MNSPVVKSLQKTLDLVDKKASYAVFNKSQRLLPRLKPFLLALEWSCHGLIWLATTILLIVCNTQQSSMLPKLLIGLIVDIICVAILKALARRRRPSYAFQRDQMIVASVDKHSFPSGHCSRSTYVAFFTSLYFAQSSPLFAFIISLWCLCVCVSRVLLGRHHILDCVAGVFLGWLNYTLQFHSPMPINFIGMLMIRAMFGSNSFGDPNDMDNTEAFD